MKLILLNGLTDLPLDDLEGLTPLQKAKHPALDYLAQHGSCFQWQPPQHGGHETSLLALLGVDEGKVARAPLEAQAVGVDLQEDETAYSVRFVSTADGVVIDVDDHLIFDEEGEAFCLYLSDGTHRFVHLKGPTALLITTDPSLQLEEVQPPLGPPTAVVGKQVPFSVQRWCNRLEHHEINGMKVELEEPPANGLLLSGGGKAPSWSGKKFEGRAAISTDDPLSKGIARVLEIPIVSELPESGLGILEINALWESTYSGNLLEKVKRIEWIDRTILAPLVESGEAITLLPLRHTDIKRGAQLNDPVPVVSYPGEGPHLDRFEEDLFMNPTCQPKRRTFLRNSADKRDFLVL